MTNFTLCYNTETLILGVQKKIWKKLKITQIKLRQIPYEPDDCSRNLRKNDSAQRFVSDVKYARDQQH